MDKLKMAALATALAVFSFGCSDDDDDDDGSPMDAGPKLDAGDSGSNNPEGGTLACTSWTEPMNGMCGGPHCQQTQAQLRASAPTTATCGSDMEIAGLCTQAVVKTVSTCTVTHAFDPEASREANITTCARMTHGSTELSDACMNCYVDAALCAVNHCLQVCLNPNTTICDDCRIANGCVSAFYTCGGVPQP
jgi:hypothetical protein